MELKFFKNNEYIFTITTKKDVCEYFNTNAIFSSIYNLLGEYSNQLSYVFKRWYDLSEKTFKNNGELIFYSNSKEFLLLLPNKGYTDKIFIDFEIIDNSDLKYKDFILIIKMIQPSKGNSKKMNTNSSSEETLEYTILEIIPIQDDFAILLSFLITNIFFRFSLECVKTYNILIKSLMTNKHLKKWVELDKNKNYIYENIIKYQDLIYDTILDSIEEFSQSSSIYILIKKSIDLVDIDFPAGIKNNIVNFYEKYYSDASISLESVPLELEEYLILVDKILNKKSKF